MQRRKHSIEFKQQVVQEAIETGNKALVANNLNFLINSSVLIFSIVGTLFAAILFVTILIPSKTNYFKESSKPNH